ncbi:MAG: cytochrome ubiquinol oxidase subunit, partial [Actinomycetota bacterium]
GLLSFLATGSTSGEVKGINDLQAEYTQKYGDGWYAPNIPTTYWAFRLMIGLGMVAMLWALISLYITRGGRTPTSRWFSRISVAMPFAPLIGISFGWIFTEMGRQPWIVFGEMKVADAVSPGVSPGSVLFTMLGYTAIYAILAVIEFGLFTKTIKQGPLPVSTDPYAENEDKRQLTFAY